jgi:nitrogen regulatory protein PII
MPEDQNVQNKTPCPPAPLKLLFLIVDWDKSKAISEVFEKEHANFVFMSKAMGTATSEILDILGVGGTDKALILCLEEGASMPVLIRAVRRKMGVRSAGAGIAFTVPLLGINAPIMELFLKTRNIMEVAGASKDNEKKEGASMETKPKGEAMKEKTVEIKNNVIISILNNGYSDEFMKTARKAGARGGTVISARGLSSQKTKKFFGISIQDEKEIIIVLTEREKSLNIMQAVSAAYGASSKAEGIVFSLPVDQVMSLNDIG